MFQACKRHQLPFLLLSALLLFGIIPGQAVAGIVTTTQIVNARHDELARKHLSDLLARKDVQQALTARGVDVAAAQSRVASLSDDEVQALAANIDKLPAGGRLSTTQLLLVIIIIILLI